MTSPSIEDGLPRLLMQTWKSNALYGGNGWFQAEQAEYYFRVGPRYAFKACITIAHIKTPTEFEKTGIFTRTIQRVRAITVWPILLEGTRQDFAKLLIDHYGWEVARGPYVEGAPIDLILTGSGKKIYRTG